MGNSTDKILKYIPSKFNKNPGSPGPFITIKGAGSPTQLRTGASNIYQVADTVGFTLDLVFSDLNSAKEELYIGVNPININIAYFPTEDIIVVDNFADTVIDNSGNIVYSEILSLGSSSLTVDLNYYFYINPSATNIDIALPDPSNVLEERYTLVKNSGTVNFIMYGLTVYPGQTIILNWVPQTNLADGTTFLGRWAIAAGSYYNFNPQTQGEVNTINPPILKNQFDIISIFSLVSNISQINTTIVNQQTIQPLQSVLFQWNKVSGSWAYSQTNYIYELVPTGADSLSGNYYLPEGGSWLDDVGRSYGTSRIYEETDSQYKNRIRELIVGPKVTLPGIATIFAIIFQYYPQIFNWYSSDYSKMLALIGGSAAYQYNSISNEMVVYNISSEPNYPNYGIPGNFYVLVNENSILNLNDAVYADYSFDDWPDHVSPSISNYLKYGGFFEANPGEVLGSNTNNLIRIGQLLDSIKLAGTVPILVTLPS